MAWRAYFIPGLTFIRGFLDSGGLLTAPYNGQPNITAGKSSCNFWLDECNSWNKI